LGTSLYYAEMGQDRRRTISKYPCIGDIRIWPTASDVAAQAIVSFQGNCRSDRRALKPSKMTRSGHSERT